MKYNPEIHHRRSIRLQGYDYSRAGAYFLTLCTQNREHLLGDIRDGEMRLNEAGRIVADSWIWLATQYEYVELDEWVIMPNHVHGIIVITDQGGGGSTHEGGFIDEGGSTHDGGGGSTDEGGSVDDGRGGSRTAPTAQPHPPPDRACHRTAPAEKRKPVGRLVGAYKTVSTKHVNELRATPGAKLWQRNYWEHIIRNDPELNRIREYIRNNPIHWETDRLRTQSESHGRRYGRRSAPSGMYGRRYGRFANRPYHPPHHPDEIRAPQSNYTTEDWMI